MVGIIIFLSIFAILEGIIIGEVVAMSKKAGFTLEVDDHDIDDVKIRLISSVDFKPGRIYFLKCVRK